MTTKKVVRKIHGKFGASLAAVREGVIRSCDGTVHSFCTLWLISEEKKKKYLLKVLFSKLYATLRLGKKFIKLYNIDAVCYTI